MYEVEVEVPFESAHRLYRYQGKCNNLHGHSYVAYVTIGSDELVSTGFVVDFGIVKNFVKKWIDDHWDHAAILYHEDHLLNLLKLETKVYSFDGDPTAERMAEWLWGVVEEYLMSKHNHAKLQSVSIRETATSVATYRGGV